MENQNMGTNTQGAENAENVQNNEGAQGAGQNEKMFTQDDVNRIVGERLARVKNTQTSAESSEREKALDLRERQLTPGKDWLILESAKTCCHWSIAQVRKLWKKV